MDKLKKLYQEMTNEQREGLAQRCGTSAYYLRNIAYGQRKASPKLAAIIERETGGVVTRKDLFPKDWHIIWPELQ